MKPYLLFITMSYALIANAQDPAPYVSSPTPPPDAVSVPTNLLKNGSFEFGKLELGEAPDDWGFIAKTGGRVNAGVTEMTSHTGKRAVGMGAPFLSNDKWQVLAFNVPVE